uniref:Variant surface glycoprotein 515 n=1 Tax=Trypanosoma brucei TaxID=5691 RepID=M4SY95_9TRYP|nr:variant surface glycoprotein 515 [Trypanosoma brucei]
MTATQQVKAVSFNRALLTLATLAVTTAGGSCQSTTTDDDISTACHVYTYIVNLQHELNGLRKSLPNDEEASRKRQRQYTIAAQLAEDQTQKCLIAAIAADAAEMADSLRREAQAASQRITDGIEALQPLIAEAAQAAALSKVSFKMHTTPGANLDNTAVAVRLTPNTVEMTKCLEKDENGNLKLNTKTITRQHHKKLKVANKQQLTKELLDPAVKLTTQASCDNTQGEWAIWGTAAKSCSTTTPTTLAPAIHTPAELNGKAQITEHSLFKNDNPQADCLSPDEIATATTPTEKTLLHSLCKALKTQMPTATPTKLQGEDLSNSPAVRQVAQGCLPNFMKKSKMEQRDLDNLKNFLKTTYGESAAAFQAKFKHLVEEAEVQVYRDGEVKSVKINTITTPVEQHDALNRLRSKQVATKLASRQNPATTDQKESGHKTGEKKEEQNKAECVATAEDKCDKTKCEWIKEKSKCKVKGASAVISAVIKAPLLLEFLILA